MKQRQPNKGLLARLTAWVDGDREDQDRTLFIMEHQRPARFTPPTEEEHDEREQQRLHSFFDWYPLAAVTLCGLLTVVLLAAVVGMPAEGVVEPGGTLASGSWEMELLGECFLLFLAVCGVRGLLLGREPRREELTCWRELPRRTLLTGIGTGLVLMVVLTWLLGGIAGGSLTGALLALPGLLGRRRPLHCRGRIQAVSLLLCVALGGVSIHAGTNGLIGLETAAAELLEIFAALSAACAVYAVCTMAAEKRADF